MKIIVSSGSKKDMRAGVRAARVEVKKAFIRAHFGCSLFS